MSVLQCTSINYGVETFLCNLLNYCLEVLLVHTGDIYTSYVGIFDLQLPPQTTGQFFSESDVSLFVCCYFFLARGSAIWDNILLNPKNNSTINM
jgi:hypothetical protein